ncbi:zinc-binding alcohol dehydrogenase family protein [Frankia torreyi]|uniref:Probable alcohol dehydrogenase AdhA n=1 Tax=Frankia torreyi TaxID=1856 RepID=A0A0D8B733_9ACTN|nr:MULTISPECIES: zinc-dependent alcohol dehydrogenase family protein [Frankia]KJE19910.1 zinc-binding alcohol dehydrogenase family protein [Frankia torreyi]KQM02230.1 zinc-binding alcohol dehydrogenase family protein [Frankia sp. CpI1-P]
MRAWQVVTPGPMGTGPLRAAELPVPEPGPGQVRLRVDACGVCRTDLHLAEGDLGPHRPRTVPGHEVVGRVDAIGPGVALAPDTAVAPDTDAATPPSVEPGAEGLLGAVDSLGAAGSLGAADVGVGVGPRGVRLGDRLGVAWLASTDGTCVYCARGAENLCPASTYTGWDVDGGYAEYVCVRADYAYRLPTGYSDAELAPLLCAGIVGYRALRRAELPPGGRLGIYGFGASAHLAAQVAIAQGARVHVLTRSARAQALALELGAASASGAYDAPPEPLDAAVLFAPVGELVPVALAALDRGGTLSVAGIHLSDIPPLVYADHLFQERDLRSTTANTRADGAEFLAIAAEHRLAVTVSPYPLAAADRALGDLAADRVTGAAVLLP